MKHLKNEPMQPSCNNDPKKRKKERKKENEGAQKRRG
jgi:hypothetical protein